VIAISVDGLNPDAIRQLGTSGAPSFHRMLDQGSGTLNARTAVERTVTLPNHTGMLTGRRVLSDRGHHVTMNDDPGGTVHALAGHYVASFFDVVHDRGGSTALLTQKDKFALFDRTWGPAHGAKDTAGADDGRDKIDKFVLERAAPLVRRLVRNLEGDAPRTVTFLHLALPDLAGHAYGFMSPRYVDAVGRTDGLLGRILDTVADDPYLSRSVDVVLTADHGGRGAGHSVATDEDNYTIPFLVWGVDVAGGEDLYTLNPERTRPGHRRPGYRTPPIRNTDLASLVTALLSMPEVPGGLPHTDPLTVS
jgi:predicted AlkP superfamily pyrophosphatase or phosphodiesterase